MEPTVKPRESVGAGRVRCRWTIKVLDSFARTPDGDYFYSNGAPVGLTHREDGTAGSLVEARRAVGDWVFDPARQAKLDSWKPAYDTSSGGWGNTPAGRRVKGWVDDGCNEFDLGLPDGTVLQVRIRPE